MTTRPRIIFASVWAPLALFLVPIVGAIGAMIEPSSIPGDDAPRRAGAAILVLIPFAYSVVALLMAAAGYFLSAIGKLNLRNLLVGACLLSLAVGASAALDSPFGVRDQIVSFCIFGVFAMLSLSLGVVCWWYLAHLGQDKSANQEMSDDA